MKEKNNPILLGGYALGEIGCQMSWYMINSYLTFFYTDIVGLSAAAISFIMLVARVWDTINDPMMGDIADKTNTRWGRFRPYLIFGPPVLAIFNILTFTVFPVQGTLKIVLALLTYIGAGMAYTVCSIAYQALQNVIAIDSNVRMNLATARGIGGAVIGMILSKAIPSMLTKFSRVAPTENPNAHGFFMTTLIVSIVLIPLFWITAAICKETYTEKLHAGTKEKQGFLENLRELVKNDQLLMIVLCTIGGAMCVSGRMGILVYYIINVVGGFQHVGNVFFVMTVAQLIGTVLIPVGVKIFGKRNYMLLLNVVMIIGFVVLYLNPHCSISFLMVVSAILGVTNSAAAICPGMIADCLEYGAWKLGKRQEGLAASFLSFGVKLSTAISGSLGIVLLTAFGYSAQAAEQSAKAVNGINFVVNMIPAIVAFLSIIPLFFYKLNAAKVAEIRADLDAGKTAAK